MIMFAPLPSTLPEVTAGSFIMRYIVLTPFFETIVEEPCRQTY